MSITQAKAGEVMNQHKRAISGSFHLNHSGYSLVELLIAMVVSAIVLTGIYSVFRAQQNSYVGNSQSVTLQQNLRAALYLMEREIRLAGYHRTGGSCATIIGARLGEIRFTWDDDDNGTCDGTVEPAGTLGPRPNEDLTFGMPVTGVDANRGGVPDTGVPVASIGRRRGGTTQNFDPIANNIERIAFGYAYDDDQNGVIDVDGSGDTIWAYDTDNDGDLDTDIAGNAVNPNVLFDRIRLVRIWIVARSNKGLPNYGGTRTFMNDPLPVVYNPGTDKPASPYTTNDNFMRRELDTIIKCRNMGLRISTS